MIYYSILENFFDLGATFLFLKISLHITKIILLITLPTNDWLFRSRLGGESFMNNTINWRNFCERKHQNYGEKKGLSQLSIFWKIVLVGRLSTLSSPSRWNSNKNSVMPRSTCCLFKFPSHTRSTKPPFSAICLFTRLANSTASSPYTRWILKDKITLIFLSCYESELLYF